MTMQPPAWVEAYVGIPFTDLGRTRQGCDCWGLVRLILAEQRGLVLPCYATSYRTETNWQGVAREIGTAQAGGDWHRIDESEVRAFDVVSLLMPLRIPGSGPGTRSGWRYEPVHVGLVVARGLLIHVEVAAAAVIARYAEDQAMRRRVHSFWRHESLADA